MAVPLSEEQIRKTIDQLVKFGAIVARLKAASDQRASLTIDQFEADALIWGLQMLKERRSR